MIPLTFAQWLRVNKNHGNVASLATVPPFRQEYVTPEVERLEKRPEVYYLSQIEPISASLDRAIAAQNFVAAGLILGLLVNEINKVCRRLGEDHHLTNPVRRYAEGTLWAGPEEAVEAMDRLVQADHLVTRKPAEKRAPPIPGIKWSTAKRGLQAGAIRGLPENLVKLIRDIRNAARAGGFVDERDDAQRIGKSITPKVPGTLRSWHTNAQGALPKIEGNAPPIPLHVHYQGTSQQQKGTGADVDEPIGYAEYTGCGIFNDAHHVKLVLDYINMQVYVTVTHYQRWDKTGGDNPKYKIQDKNSGDNSAWFYIDFTQ